MIVLWVKLRTFYFSAKQHVSHFPNGCSTVLMQYQKTRIFDEIIDTCRPEVQPGYILMLNVIYASPQCPLIIKNAQLDYSEIPAFA
uniref:Uncharacterized protein n=1 Tax=Panagrolaimus sp. ES5 TaxID=591445 RepID=A0AC34GKR8_9BILA